MWSHPVELGAHPVELGAHHRNQPMFECLLFTISAQRIPISSREEFGFCPFAYTKQIQLITRNLVNKIPKPGCLLGFFCFPSLLHRMISPFAFKNACDG